MNTDLIEKKRTKKFLDIPSAAYLAGFSSRHFRRIIEEDHIPVMQIGRKLFIVAQDLDAWKETRGDARLSEAIKKVDGWLKESLLLTEQPTPLEDEL